jgi:hypothetical protein
MTIPTIEMGDLLGVSWPEKRVERFRRQVGIPTGGPGHHQPMSACECHQFFVYDEIVNPLPVPTRANAKSERIWAPALRAVTCLYRLYPPSVILDARWILVDLSTSWRLFWDDLAASAELVRVGAGALVGLRLPEPAWHRIYAELANEGHPALSMS